MQGANEQDRVDRKALIVEIHFTLMASFCASTDNVFLTDGRRRETTGSFQSFSSVSTAVVTSNRMTVGNRAALMRFSGEIKREASDQARSITTPLCLSPL